MRAMMIGVVGVALLVSAGCATSPSAYRNRDEPINRTTGEGQQYYGNVARVDEAQQIVVLDNGQIYRIAPGNQSILVNGHPTLLSGLQPGMPVTIVNGTPVAYQNGQYVTLPAGTVVTTPVVAAPGTTVVTAPNVMRLYGRVTDVDRDGTVRVKLPAGDSFEFRPPAGTVVRKGDTIAIDMTVGAVQPSALPR
jgi:uncharacterized cupin superfamily protein